MELGLLHHNLSPQPACHRGFQLEDTTSQCYGGNFTSGDLKNTKYYYCIVFSYKGAHVRGELFVVDVCC